ncbi:O-antigen biosynthesis glycosyltransferase WbnK-like [Bradysia coprophila]|uniref:O-antigen biosynthesis glycosyltransferase WbnK-like n=1 Tax=Bradysia coprophila TaxID=38358 RepID=UPI00187DA6E6|nr:O-antigen biosynthesis glycosyltransferase WbnK-like [Bradysia coprophila]
MKFRVKVILLLLLSLLIIIIYGLRPRKTHKIEEYSHTTIGKSPPIVTEILGGLGNQLFQYAAAYSIAKKRNSDIYICVNGFDVNLKAFISSYYSSEQRKYLLDHFNVPQDKLLFLYPSANFKWNRFDEIQCGIDYYLNGRKVENYIVTEVNVLAGDLPDDKVLLIKDVFESDVFFAPDKLDILNIFQPTFDTHPIDDLIKMVSSTENSVSVHIRRGDMARKDDFRLISLSYQREAMQLVKRSLQTRNVTFFVFSDDLDYVKNHLDEGSDTPNRIIYMSDFTENNTLYDFLLMSLCQHNIIPNSSFSWWAAYLNKNPDKIVVAPLPKYRSEWINEFYPSDHSKLLLGELAYPKGWLTIKPMFLNYSEQRGQ